MPGTRAPNVQLFEEMVQETLVEPDFVAVTTTVPENEPETLIVGVLSEVILSDEELPESEAVSSAGVAGVATVVDVGLYYLCFNFAFDKQPVNLLGSFVLKATTASLIISYSCGLVTNFSISKFKFFRIFVLRYLKINFKIKKLFVIVRLYAKVIILYVTLVLVFGLVNIY